MFSIFVDHATIYLNLKKLEEFIEYLNKCHPSIKFTAEISDSEVNFLDTMVHLDPDGSLWTDLYSKPTDSHNYLRFESSHPRHCMQGLPYSQFLRVRRGLGRKIS